ncbi:hypothetical protein HK101_000226 [Irineochytrium annulatum]|nr:hypothetical protein HK101_000226 [Irineochytrium annulatum]
MKKVPLILMAVNVGLVSLTTGYYILRRNHPEIARTGWPFTLTQTLSSLAISTVVLLFRATDYHFPGVVLFNVLAFCMPLFMLCVIGKTIRLLVLYRWNERKLTMSEAMTQEVSSLMRGNVASKSLPRALLATRMSREKGMGAGSKVGWRERAMRLLTKWFMGTGADGQAIKIIKGRSPEVRVARLIWRFIVVVMGFMAVCNIVVQVVLPGPVAIYPTVAEGWDIVPLFYQHFVLTYAFTTIYVLFVAPLAFLLIRGIQDANGIKVDVMTSMVAGIPCFGFYLIFTYIPVPWVQSIHNRFLNNCYVVSFFFFVAHFSSVVLPIYNSLRADRDYRLRHSDSVRSVRHQRSVRRRRTRPHRRPSRVSPSATPTPSSFKTDSDAASLEDIPALDVTIECFQSTLNDPHLFRLFKRFCAQDFSVASALFHEAWALFRQAMASLIESREVPAGGVNRVFGGVVDLGDGQIRVDTTTPIGAQIGFSHYIWETFIEDGTELEVKALSWEAKGKVEEGLREGVYPPDLFDELAKENRDYMFSDIFPKAD